MSAREATEALCRLLRIPEWAGEMNFEYITSGTLRDRLALARALVPEMAVSDKAVPQIALMVLCAARDGQSWHENFLKDFNTAIEGLRAMLAASDATP